MYRNRERLARALAVCVEHYGPDVLRDSQRTRNLLVDEFGGDNLADRSDIEQFVSVLNAAQASVTRPDLPVSSAAAAAAAAAGVTLDDAAWTITTLRSLTARLPPESPRPGGNGRLGPVGPTVLEPDDVTVVPAAPPPRRWPTVAKVAVTVIACLAVAAIAAGGVLLARSRSDVDFVCARTGPPRSTPSSSSDGRDRRARSPARPGQGGRRGRPARAPGRHRPGEHRDGDDGRSPGQGRRGNTAVADLTAQRDAANSSVASLQQQLDAANQLAAPFGVGQGGVAVPTRGSRSPATPPCARASVRPNAAVTDRSRLHPTGRGVEVVRDPQRGQDPPVEQQRIALLRAGGHIGNRGELPRGPARGHLHRGHRADGLRSRSADQTDHRHQVRGVGGDQLTRWRSLHRRARQAFAGVLTFEGY